jgi:hypothetical protein
LNAKKHLEEVIKDRDACSAKTLELRKDRDLWKGRCNQMVAGIMPVLDLINPELPAPEVEHSLLECSTSASVPWDGFNSS